MQEQKPQPPKPDFEKAKRIIDKLLADPEVIEWLKEMAKK